MTIGSCPIPPEPAGTDGLRVPGVILARESNSLTCRQGFRGLLKGFTRAQASRCPLHTSGSCPVSHQEVFHRRPHTVCQDCQGLREAAALDSHANSFDDRRGLRRGVAWPGGSVNHEPKPQPPARSAILPSPRWPGPGDFLIPSFDISVRNDCNSFVAGDALVWRP